MAIKTVSEINSYQSMTVNPIENPEQIYELYSVPSFDMQYPEIIKGSEIGSSKVIVEEGDVLVCKINPRINRVWVVKHYTKYPLLASSEWIVVRNKDIESNYLKWYFSSPTFRTMLTSQVAGIGGSLTRAQPKQVAKYPVPIPDRSEQKEIVRTLDKIDALISLRKQQLTKLDELVKSRFVELFGDPSCNPMGWKETTVGAECYYIKDGPHKSLPDVGEGNGYPFISVRNIVNGYIDFSTAKYISEQDYLDSIKKCHPQKGDMLYSKGGTTGIAKLIDVDVEFANWVHVAVLKFDDTLNGIFFENMLNCDYCYDQSQRLTKGIANRDLVLSAMAQIKMYKPPLELQEKFAAFVEQTDKSKFEIQKSLDKLEILKKSLMQQYFG